MKSKIALRMGDGELVSMSAEEIKEDITAATREAAQRADIPELTADERAVVEQARALQKDIRIARLELALAEAKEAPESEIAGKAENVYRLQGKAHALRAKHRELFGKLQRQRARRGPGMGFGRGQQMGPQGRRVGPGMGHGMRRGMGQGVGPQMGHGMRRGMGPGVGAELGRRMREGMGPGMPGGMGEAMGPQMGRGMRQGMGPAGPMMRGRHAPPMEPPPGPEEMLPPPVEEAPAE